jgi:selenide, water dikinase
VLRSLPVPVDANVLIGAATADDAAVYRLSPDQALVATVDYITPVVDDPYEFGAIAAANSLSDVYAMGARPIFALNVVGFPRDVLPLDVLGRILEGGAAIATEAGIGVIGGHSVDDPEPKYGLVALGLVHPDRIVANAGARPGDRLFLTKPLGIGVLTTAIKRDLAPPASVDQAIRSMRTLNRAACEAMLEVGPHAATDVTGFGLVGHLLEMLNASGVGARLRFGRVPLLDGVWDLVRAGCYPGGSQRNHEHVSARVDWGDLDAAEQLVLADAQTSGGLLIAVPAERADALRAALAARGTLAAAEIGEVTSEVGRVQISRD